MAAKDILVVGGVLFALAIGLFVMNFATHQVVDRFESNEAINSSAPTIAAMQSMDTVANRMDYIFFGFFIGVVLALMITSWLIGAHFIFILFYFLVLVVGVAMAPIWANTWETVTGMAVFGTTISNFPLTNHILLNLPYYLAAIGVLGLFIIFGKQYISGETYE